MDDNIFLLAQDKDYKRRLENLSEREKKALLYGDWDIFDGQYFPEFNREIHVCDPFPIPPGWRRYRTLDYGLDRLACLWVAMDSERNVFVYRELCESNLMISDAAAKICAMTPEDENIYATLAPPDLWSRSQESGKSKADLFDASGLSFTRTSNDREAGWLAVKELLKVQKDGLPRLHIFSQCAEIIKCLPALQIDQKRPTDCANDPHEITHAPDALRGFAVFWSHPNEEPEKRKKRKWTEDMWQDYYAASSEEKELLKKRYGEPE